MAQRPDMIQSIVSNLRAAPTASLTPPPLRAMPRRDVDFKTRLPARNGCGGRVVGEGAPRLRR
jgi:hypothetical protein